MADDGDVFPGMMFSLAKTRMEKSKLWQIVRRMPKGALLHCHLEAMVELDWMLDLAFSLDGIHVWSDKSLSNEVDLAKAPFFFTYTKLSEKDSATIWSEAYTSKTPVPLEVAAESFPHGGREGFRQWVKSRTMITSEESLKHHYGVNDVWRKFASCFPILASLIFYEPFFRKYMRKMFENLHADGVRWVDIRAVFVHAWRPEDSEEVALNHDGFFTAFGEEVDKFKASEEGKGFWGARFIWTTPRIFDKRRIVESECRYTNTRNPSANVRN